MAKFENSRFQDDVENIRKTLNLKRTARNEQRDNTDKGKVNMSLQQNTSLQNQIHKRQQALAFVAEIPEPNQNERDRGVQFLQEQREEIESIIRSLGY